MTFTREEIRELRAGNADRAWAPVPDGCPPQVLNLILETRARQIDGTDTTPVPPSVPAAAPQETDALRERLKAVALF